MGIDDRDYMRTQRRVTRASDQRRPGDPRTADQVFLPGTVHATGGKRHVNLMIGIVAFIVTAIVIGLWST